MRHPIARASLLLAFTVAGHLHASTLVPMQGQTSAQIQSDTAACQAQSTQASQAAAPAPAPAPAPQGGRLRGAAVGAAAGAAGAQVRGNQHEAYDRVDSDVQQEYRQNQAKDAAAAGMVVGGAKQRQQRRSTQQQQAAQQEQAAAQSQQQGSQAFDSCMSARGYTVQP
jgi:type IV secretory pathway VirB10-like protein